MSHELSSITRAVRAGIAVDREHGAVVPPIHLTSTFAFAGFGKPRKFDYTRSGNPTRAQLADAIADLERGAGGVVTNTGMSAVGLVLQLVRPGDVVVAAHDCYGGTQRLLRALAGKGHFEVRFLDLTAQSRTSDIGHRTSDVGPRTSDPSSSEVRRPKSVFGGARLVWIETPSNPLLRITDIRRVAAEAHAAGALVVVDNTFLSPALQQPLALGADIVVHSTTKYLNGHSDVVGGAVVARDLALHEELAWWANATGVTGAPFDSFLTLRGIRTLHPRIRQHEANAAAVVELLSKHPAVARVYYPGLESHPGHEIAREQQAGFGAMVSFELAAGTAAVEPFTAALSCFTLAESLGGVESLIAHPATMTHASMSAEARAAAGISESLVRLSVGTEDAADLVHDLSRALDTLTGLGTRNAALDAPTRTNQQGSGATRRHQADVVLIGPGSIGRELLSQVAAFGDGFRICGLIDRSGFVFDANGIEGERLSALRGLKERGGRLAESAGGVASTAEQAIAHIAQADLWRPILVDATAADTSPTLDQALSRGFDLVLANKVPLAAGFEAAEQLWRKARLHGRRILHEATVGAGLPVIDTLRKLQEAGDTILSIEGCPSGTLGFVFGELGRGRSFSDALGAAVDAGYTEPDPRANLSGLDVARKALILARLIGFPGDLRNIAIESLVPRQLADVPRDEFIARCGDADKAWRERVTSARERGVVLRYRARATATEVSVGIVEVAESDPLGTLQGTDNQFSFVTERYRNNPLVIRGPGAGPAVTAAGVFNDLLRLAAERGGPRASSAALRAGQYSAPLRGGQRTPAAAR